MANNHINEAGFTGKNDIKKTKAEAAKESTGKTTYVFHFDFFNGKMAVVDITCALDLLPADRWKKNDSLNSAFTTPICDEKFIWKLDEAFPENVEILITKLQDE